MCVGTWTCWRAEVIRLNIYFCRKWMVVFTVVRRAGCEFNVSRVYDLCSLFAGRGEVSKPAPRWQKWSSGLNSDSSAPITAQHCSCDNAAPITAQYIVVIMWRDISQSQHNLNGDKTEDDKIASTQHCGLGKVAFGTHIGVKVSCKYRRTKNSRHQQSIDLKVISFPL